MWGRDQRGNNATCWLCSSLPFHHFPHFPEADCGLSDADSRMSKFVYVLGPCGPLPRTPVILRVSPTATTPADFYIQRFWVCSFPCRNPGLCGLSRFPVVPPSLSAHECGTSWFTSHLLGCASSPTWLPSPPLLPVGMNVSLTPWLSDFHEVWISGSSVYFLFLNLLLSFFWLCEEAKCFYLCLHRGWNSWAAFSKSLVYQYRSRSTCIKIFLDINVIISYTFFLIWFW